MDKPTGPQESWPILRTSGHGDRVNGAIAVVIHGILRLHEMQEAILQEQLLAKQVTGIEATLWAASPS